MEFVSKETFKMENDALQSYPDHESINPERVQTLRSAPFTKCECGETQVMVLRPKRDEQPHPLDDTGIITVAICDSCGEEY